MPPQKLINLICLLFCFIGSYPVAIAQDDCTSILDKAQKLYENGNIEDIPQMLAPCIEKGFSDEERLQAYKLIILSCLFDENLKDADIGMLNFLKKYPEYQLKSTDPAEFAQEFQTFRTVPIISIGISTGTNATFPYLMKSYVANGQNIEGKYNNSGMGFQGGIKLNFFLTNRLELNIETNYITNSYKYRLSIPNLEIITSTESQNKIEFPLCFTYTFGGGKFRPFVKAGGALDYLLSATSKNSIVYVPVNSQITGSDINLLPQRRQINFSAIIGAGIKYKIPRGYAFFDVRWDQGLLNQVPLGVTRFNNENTFKYQIPDNDFIINNLIVSVGYVHSFFKPVKRR